MANDLNIQGEVVMSTEQVEAAFDRVGNKAGKMATDVANSANAAGKAVDGIGDGMQKSAEKFTRAEAWVRDAIKKSTQELQTLGKTASEKFQLNIDAKGFDASKFAPYIAELKKAEEAQRIVSGSLDKMGMSAKATAAAMRGVPAQFQDIIVSLQGGQAPMTVMLQQGSQLSTMFGGVGNAAKALGGYVLGLVNPFTIAAAAVAALGVAIYSAEKTLRAETAWQAYADATGRASSMSIDAYKRLRAEMALMPGVSKSMAAAVIGDLAGMRDLGTEAIKGIGVVAADVAVILQSDMPTAAKALGKAFADPKKGVIELNDTLRVFSAQQIATIQAMADMGDRAGAQEYMLDELRKSTQGLADKGLTPLQRAAKDFGNTWDESMAKLGTGGRLQTVTELMAGFVDRTAEAVAWLSKLRLPKEWEDSFKGGLNGMVYNALTGGKKPEFTGGATGSWGENTGGASGSFGKPDMDPETKAWNERIAALRLATDGYKSTGKAISDLKDKAKDLRAAITEAEGKDGSDALVKQLKSNLAGVNEQIENLGKRGASAVKAANKELADQTKLVGHLAGLSSTFYEDWDNLAKAYKRTGGSAEDLAKAQAKLLADQPFMKAQAKDADEAEKSYRKYIDTLGKTADSIEDQALKQDAANASFGKSKVAIAELAMEQAKLAALNAKDAGPWTQEQVDKLKAIAAAHEHYVQSLREEAYLAAQRKYDDSIRAAKDELQVQQYGMTLLGEQEVTRNKLIAIRKAELKLAKELADIEKLYKDKTDDESLERRAALEKKARLNAEVELQGELGKIQDQFVTQQAQKFDDIFRQGFADMVNNGSDGLKAFGKSLKTTVLTSIADGIYQALIKKWVVNIATNLTGGIGGLVGAAGSLLGGGGSGSGGGSGAGSLLSLASNANTAYGLYTGTWGASVLGNSLVYGAATPGLTIGSQQAAMLAAQTGEFGLAGLTATQSAAGGMSTAGMGAFSGAGIGAAIVMAAAYLGGMFKSEKQVGAGLTGELGGDVYGYQLMREGGSLFSGPSYKYIIAEQELAKARAEIEELKKNPELETDGNLTYRMKYLRERVEMLEGKYGSSVDSSQGPIDALQKTYSAMRETVAAQAESLGLDGEAVRQMKTVLGLDEIHPDTGGTGLELFGLSEEEAAAKVQAAMEKANEDLARSVLGSMQEVTREITRTYAEIIPVHDEDGNVYENRIWHDVTETVTSMEWVMSEYVREGETAVAALNRISGSLVGVNQVFEMLGADLMAASIASGDWASKLIEAMGGIDNLNTVAVGYYDRYYSDDEKRARQIAAANKGMEGLGLDLRVEDDNAQQKYRNLVDGAIEAKDEALLASLLKFAEQFGLGVDAVVSAAQNHLAEMEAVKQTALSAAGLSVDSMVSGFIAEINEGRGAQAGSWLADSIAVGFEQAIYGQAVGIIMNSIIDGVVTPVITAAMAGSSVSAAVSGAAIDTMVANATAAASALNALLGDAAFNAAISDVLDVVRDLGNSIGSSIPKMSTYKSATSSLTSGYTYAGNAAESAAEKAKKLADQWSSTIDSMTEEMKRLRGELLGGSDDQGAAYYESLYAIKTAQARAGDQDAANELPSIIQTLEELAKGTAGTKAEVLLMQSAWLASLGDTRDYLAGKYGVDIGNEKSSVLGATTAVSLINDGANTSVVKALQRGSDTPALIAEIKALRAEVAALRADNRSGIEATAPAIQQMNKTLRKFDIDGMPSTRKEGKATA